MLSVGNILKDFIWISHWVANTLIKLQTNERINCRNNFEKLLENTTSTSQCDYIIRRRYRAILLVALEKEISIIIRSNDDDNLCFGFFYHYYFINTDTVVVSETTQFSVMENINKVTTVFHQFHKTGWKRTHLLLLLLWRPGPLASSSRKGHQGSCLRPHHQFPKRDDDSKEANTTASLCHRPGYQW